MMFKNLIEKKAYFKDYYLIHKAEIKKQAKDWTRAHPRDSSLDKEKKKSFRQRTKIKVLSHYSPRLVCAGCGFSNIHALTIDHIEGGGRTQEKEIGRGRLHSWLKRHNYPPGYRVLCMNCQFIKRAVNNECVTSRKKSVTSDNKQKSIPYFKS